MSDSCGGKIAVGILGAGLVCAAAYLNVNGEDAFWLVGSLWGASVGLGDDQAAERWRGQLAELEAPVWMRRSVERYVVDSRALVRRCLDFDAVGVQFGSGSCSFAVDVLKPAQLP